MSLQGDTPSGPNKMGARSVHSTPGRRRSFGKIPHGRRGMGGMREATPRQWAVLQFVIGYLDRHGYPPTHRELMAEFGLASTNAASDYLRALQRKGYVLITPGAARGIRVLGRD